MAFKLLALDVNGVLIDSRNTWMDVHAAFGTLEQGRELTAEYLKTDYNRLVEEVVVKLWKGRDASPYFSMIDSLAWMENVAELFAFAEEKGLHTALISAGTFHAAQRLQEEFDVEHVYSNELVIEDNKVTGEFRWPIGEGTVEKARVLEHVCEDLGIRLDEAIFVGDSKTDREAVKVAGLGVAFNSRDEELSQVADLVVDSRDLRDLVSALAERL